MALGRELNDPNPKYEYDRGGISKTSATSREVTICDSNVTVEGALKILDGSTTTQVSAAESVLVLRKPTYQRVVLPVTAKCTLVVVSGTMLDLKTNDRIMELTLTGYT